MSRARPIPAEVPSCAWPLEEAVKLGVGEGWHAFPVHRPLGQRFPHTLAVESKICTPEFFVPCPQPLNQRPPFN